VKEYSLLDGANKIEDIAKAAQKDKQRALAITDHGNMHGALEHYNTCNAHNIKPIIGCEFYVAKDSRLRKHSRSNGYNHLTLLARNNEGLKNLMYLTSVSFVEGLSNRPRIDMDVLNKHAAGVTCLSGCLSGRVNELILDGKEQDALDMVTRLRDLFGKDNFWLEIQRNGLNIQDKATEGMVRIHKKTGIRLVATNDIHYLRHEDCEFQDTMLCINTGARKVDTDRFRFESDTMYFKSTAEMSQVFRDLPESVYESLAVAETINLTIEQGTFHFPKSGYDNPKETLTGFTHQELLKRGLRNDTYVSRLNRELQVINDMEFAEYFLVVKDLVEYARLRGIPVGPGRGSAAGSLVSYLLGITGLDPIRHGLLFERFLNSSRRSLPDIDIDFCQENRKQVINYLKDKYGDDKVASIVTFNRFGAKKAIRQVARVYDIPIKDADAIAKRLLGDTIKDSVAKDATLVQLKQDNPRLFETSEQLEGFVEYPGTHASGIIVAPRPLWEYVPLARQARDGSIITQWDLEGCEKIGLVKFDILGLETLTVIRRAELLIEERHGVKLSLDSIPQTHPEVYQLLCKGDTEGVFQCYSDGMKRLLADMQPDCFDDVIAAIALFRPGPLESGIADSYIKRKHGKEKVTYVHPDLEEIMKNTYGTMVYQEQIMRLASTLAGFSLNEADELRKAVGKKLPEVLAKIKERFLDGCKVTGKIVVGTAAEIWDQIEKFGRYGFNASHSASYAYLTYYTGYLKCFYPTEFFTANLTQEIGNPDKLRAFVNDARKRGIRILSPSVLVSSSDFTIESDKSIRMGLGAIKGIPRGTDLRAHAMDGFKHGRVDITSLLASSRIKKDTLEVLAKSGALDCTGIQRRELVDTASSLIKRANDKRTIQDEGDCSLFGVLSEASGPSNTNATHTESILLDAQALIWEREVFGFYLSGHPMESMKYRAGLTGAMSIAKARAITEDKKRAKICCVISSYDIKPIKNGPNKGKKYLRVVLEDQTNQMIGSVFARKYDELFPVIKQASDNATPVIILGSIDAHGDEPQVAINYVKPIQLGELTELKIPIRPDQVPDLAAIKRVVLRYPGEQPLSFQIMADPMFIIRTAYRVNLSDDLINELEPLL